MDPPIYHTLTGSRGECIRRSPDKRYEIRRALMVNFPAAAIVNACDSDMTCNTANPLGKSLQITGEAGTAMLGFLHHMLPNGLPIGEAVTSPPFNLINCLCIIHTNAPSYKGRERGTIPLVRQQLVDCYRRCLEEAYEQGAETIAFPCLSAGVTLGWRRRDASRIGFKTVVSWFKHPIHGAARRKQIPGPIYFLADPGGPYEHQADMWMIAFDDIWLPSQSPLIESIEVTIRPTATRGGRRLSKLNQRRSGRRVSVPPRLVRQPAGHGEIRLEEAKPRRAKRIGQRELNSLLGGNRGGTEPKGRKRDRKPPERYGQ